MQKFISYDGLPIKSGGGHQVSKYSASELYERLKHFSSYLSNAPKPQSIKLEYNGLIMEEPISFSLLWKTTKSFGLPLWSLSQYIGSGSSVWTWNITARQADKALAFHEKFNQITFAVVWHFQFTNPSNHKPLPGQDSIPVIDERMHNSQIYLRCGLKRTVSAWFVLPFNELDVYAINYIKEIQAQLPFKLSNQHWKLWQVNKGKLSSRKLDVSILEDGN